MYLKRLEIKGFKSFADNTEILLEPGLNIIVGPNGCGKSNIADAVRWVLGEGNVRQLRGQKNEDIIFNGTDKQKPQGMAMVDMTIDNADHVLPVEFGEVNVGRKMFRSGESEYLINKSRVRMKDVINLFTGTGLGKRGYSIIGQGELEQVLNGQGFDRRLLLEEASGSIRYRQQRDEVKGRIAATGLDLQRLADIIAELEIRTAELQVKSAKASAYLELMAEYSQLDKTFMASEMLDIKQNLSLRKNEWTQKSAVQKELDQSLAALNAELNQAESLYDAGRNLLTMMKDQKYGLETELGNLESEAKLGQERIHNYNERILAASQDAGKYGKMLEALNQDLKMQLDDYNLEKGKWHARQLELEGLNLEIQAMEAAIGAKVELFEQQRGQIFEQVNRESGLKNAMLSSEENIKRAREKKDRLQMRLEENRRKCQAEAEKRQALEEQSQIQLKERQEIEKQLLQLNAERQQLGDENRKLETAYQEISQTQMSIENRLLALQDLERKYVGYSEGVRAVLQAQAAGEPSLRGMKGLMADLIDVPAGMELAIEIAAGKGLENIVVARAEEAQAAIHFLKRQRLGRVTFLPLDVLRVSKVNPRMLAELIQKEGVLGLASQLVKFDDQYEKAVEYLLGRVLLVSDLDRGMQVFKNSQQSLRIVSLEGDLINVSGAMTGGASGQKKTSPIMRKGEEKKLRLQLEQVQTQRDANRQLFEALSLQAQALDEQLMERRNLMAEHDFQQKLIQAELAAIKLNLEQGSSENEMQLQEIEALHNSLQLMEAERLQLQQDYRELCTENVSFTEQVEAMKESLGSDRREYEVRKERALSHQDQLNMKQRELVKLENNLAQFMEVQSSYQQSVEDAERIQTRLQHDRGQQEQMLGQNNEQRENKQRELAELQAALIKQQEAHQAEGEHIDRLRSQLRPWLEDKTKTEESLRTLEMRMVRIETEMEAARDKWTDKYHPEAPEQYERVMTNGEMRDYKRRIEELKEKIEILGPVDIESIKEYEELKTRYDFLQQQRSDLVEARQSLEKLLNETEKIMAKNFAQFMLLANESFQRTFSEIFGGGEANLILEDDSNYLSAGVDIVLKMPGKRSQALNLLSGGEKALTCIAFIFALLRLRPAPFCLLDEIDAALDETNLMRFTQFLKGMAEDIQFIIITHRQATIEAGTNIYGVTMPQEGISSILSISVNESISMAI